ncbi:MAG: glutamate-1-semialdehyde 2,1-aminomutase [Solirubrobacteraceae bacterium]
MTGPGNKNTLESEELRTERSSRLYHRARELLPGGVNSPVRAMRAISRDPIFIARGEGSTLIDVDGNEYIDWVSSWGPLVLGHANRAVVDAVVEAAVEGLTFGAPTEREVKLAEEITRRVPSVQMLRMTSSGTEATMSVLRLARAVTGRRHVLKFAGAYHGHVDGLLVEGGSGLATLGMPASAGVDEATAQATVVVPWNDARAVREAAERYEPAVILAEPVAANMGVVPPEEGFLEVLRECADRTGALLVFDEVITGFRVAYGGAQEHFDVLPDLTILGKIIGGGLPAAAYGGAPALMERISPAGDVYQAGTLSGNPVATAAALATLECLPPESYERLERTTTRLAAGLRDAAAAAGVPLQVQAVTGLLTPFFSSRPVCDYAGAMACDLEAYGAWCRALLEQGIYPPPSQFEAWFPSLAHSDEDVDRTVEAARVAFGELLR